MKYFYIDKNYQVPLDKTFLPPIEAYYYLPNFEKTIRRDPKTNEIISRLIFEGKCSLEYTEFELSKLNEIKHFLNTKQIILSKFWTNANILRFLQSNNYDIEKTAINIKISNDWRKKNIPITPNENLFKLLNTGFVYINGRDNQYRPIIIIRMSKYKENLKAFSMNELKLSFIVLSEFIINNMLIPGQVETWNIICDLKDVSLFSIASKEIFEDVLLHYKCRLSTLYVINVSGVASLLWKLVKSYLGEGITKKIKVIKDIQNELFVNINKSQIEQIFSGDCENLKDLFFPPKMPNGQIKTLTSDNIVNDAKLIREIETNPLMIIPPFVKQNKLEINKEGLMYNDEFFFSLRSEEDREEIIKNNDFEIKKVKAKRKTNNMNSFTDDSETNNLQKKFKEAQNFEITVEKSRRNSLCCFESQKCLIF